jgi:hypothetical protein
MEKIADKVSGSDDRMDAIAKILLTEVSLVKAILGKLVPDPKIVGAVGIITGQAIVETSGQAIQLPGVIIQGGYTVVIRALPSNVGTCYIGDAKDTAESHNRAFPLVSGEYTELQVNNLGNVYVDSDTSGEGIAWIVEKIIGSE